jgi:hypothetical protein
MNAELATRCPHATPVSCVTVGVTGMTGVLGGAKAFMGMFKPGREEDWPVVPAVEEESPSFDELLLSTEDAGVDEDESDEAMIVPSDGVKRLCAPAQTHAPQRLKKNIRVDKAFLQASLLTPQPY